MCRNEHVALMALETRDGLGRGALDMAIDTRNAEFLAFGRVGRIMEAIRANDNVLRKRSAFDDIVTVRDYLSRCRTRQGMQVTPL
jgi:hypothetical protein